MSKKILIIGNSAKEYALAKKLSEKYEIYVASGSDAIKEFAHCVDIREDASAELLEFVMENGIDLTVPLSLKTLNTDIVNLFNINGQQIFAPNYEVVRQIFDKTQMKRLLYKLRIPTPRFGIFEKQNVAQDYIKNSRTPFVIKTNEPSSAVVLTSLQSAKNIVDSCFEKKGQKVLIEDYVWGTPFSYYVITDGYKALPIGTSIVYKHSLEGNGGQLTNGMGACVPCYKLSAKDEQFIMESIVNPLFTHFEDTNMAYLGILGIEGIISDEGDIKIIGLNPFMTDVDCSAVLEILDCDLVELIESCIIGNFSDEVDFVPQSDRCATSLVLNCKNRESKENIVEGLDSLDEDTSVDFYPQTNKNRYLEFEAQYGPVIVLTAFARTLATSTSKVYEEAECIKFKGISYRKDICVFKKPEI